MSRNARWFEEPRYAGRWDILGGLAALDEAARKSILRPHEDEKTRKPAIEDVNSFFSQRSRLDDALDELTQFEIELECAGPAPARKLTAEEALPQLEAFRILIGSDSFLRYLNTYLYFGVRILLRRFFQPGDAHFVSQGEDINRLPWWLEVPPPLSRGCVSVPVGESLSESEDLALSFLDGTLCSDLKHLHSFSNLPETLELCIRGLRPDLRGPVGDVLEQIGNGLAGWAHRQAKYYLFLAGKASTQTDPLPVRPKHGWGCDTPRVARVVLGDFYWISGLLRAEVTAEGRVFSGKTSWLGLMRFRAAESGDTKAQQDLQGTEEILRQVFSMCCDLVQNASDLALISQKKLAGAKAGCSKEKAEGARPSGWREVFDAELDEVSRQRTYREYGSDADMTVVKPPAVPGASGWSKRLYDAEAVPDLIGVAMSGGGIRSATFNIGVLQGLQELDLLRQVDYISTVSGGGFAGSWLIANVKRSTYWLGRLTPWDSSIDHLRNYSNYLAPRTGVLSMDTWSLGALWLRNTLLIQLTALVWLLVVFTVVCLERLHFTWVAQSPGRGSAVALLLLALTVIASLGSSLLGLPGWTRRGVVLFGAVLPAWVGSAGLAARIFAIARRNHIHPVLDWIRSSRWVAPVYADVHATGNFDYSVILKSLLFEKEWFVLQMLTFGGLLIVTMISLFTSSTASRSWASRIRRGFGALGIALLCTAVVHLCLCLVVYGCRYLLHTAHFDIRLWFVLATVEPASVLLTYALAILLLIGLAGRASDPEQREWWTRYGAWILAFAALGMVLPLLAFGAPWLIHWGLAQQHHRGWIKWGAIASWVATTVGGLLAGRSSRTMGDSTTRSPSLQMLANIGGIVFLLGAAMGAAELLFLFLRAYNSEGTGYGVLGFEYLADWKLLLSTLVVLLICGTIFALRFDLNVFGLSELYRNRLVRCYLGATRWEPGKRKLQPFTQFDFKDDIKLEDLAHHSFRGPFPILNCSLNLSGSPDLALHTRHSAAFTMTPLHCGSSREQVGYRRTSTFAGGLWLGQAVAVSGAAASPNMGYNTAPLVALLLTLFNVRLGWWFRNPGRVEGSRIWPLGLQYLAAELLGSASERRAYVNVTDGGHFENLGIYELVRRRSQLIIACDAECDETMTFTGLANAIRLCATDFGAVIKIDLASLHRGTEGLSRTHSAVGIIRYSNGSVGRLIYIKASITGDEDATVTQYLSGHPTFPHETTANQFFKEEQFESYRRLGQHIVRNALRGALPRESLVRIAERLMDTMTPAASTTEKFLQHTQALEKLWQHFRQDHPMQLQRNGFLMELMGHSTPGTSRVNADITCIGMELLQVMENIFIDLRLDDFWEHPDHRGWALLFMGWARSPRFRMVWQQNHHTFGIRFEHFCASRLGLVKDDPVLRVSPLTRD